MCQKCGTYTSGAISQRTIERRQKEQEKQAYWALGLSMAGSLFNILNQVIPSKDENNKSIYSKGTRTKDDEIKEIDDKEKVEELKTLLGTDTYDKLSSDLKEDILLKYDVLKSVRKLEDETLKTRLNKYIEIAQNTEKKAEVKAFIETTLTEANVTYDTNLIDNIIEKHNLLELFDPTNNNQQKIKQLKQKIIDYTNGTKYSAAEVIFENNIEQTFIHQTIKTAIEQKDSEGYKNAHLQFGQEMIEVYDIANPDGKIDFVEYASYQAKLNNVENITEEITEATKLLFKIQDMNSDGYIDQNEMSADLWATATILDTAETPVTLHEITKEEYKTTELGKQAYGAIMLMTEYSEGWDELDKTARENKYREAFATLSTEEQTAYKQYTTVRQKARNAFLPQE